MVRFLCKNKGCLFKKVNSISMKVDLEIKKQNLLDIVIKYSYSVGIQNSDSTVTEQSFSDIIYKNQLCHSEEQH